MGAVVGGAAYGATSGAAFGGAVGMLFERYGIRENAANIRNVSSSQSSAGH